jgi:hypothetical protein
VKRRWPHLDTWEGILFEPSLDPQDGVRAGEAKGRGMGKLDEAGVI